MSEENVEIVRRGFEAYERGDAAGMVADIAENAVIHRFEPDARTWTGPEGLLQAMVDWTEGFDDWTLTPEDYAPVDDAHVIVRTLQTAIGRESRVPIAAPFWLVFAVRGDAIVRVEFHAREDEAMEATRRG